MIFDMPQMADFRLTETHQMEPVRKRRRGGRGRAAAAVAIGAIILIPDGNGGTMPCRLAWVDANGTPWCYPVPPG